MRILVAHNVDRRRAGGMSRIMEFIHDEVAAHGHTVEWLTAEDVPAHWNGARMRFGFPWLVWSRARRAVVEGHPFDVVNVHEPHSMLVALAQQRLTRYGVVVTSHGLERRAWELALDERRLGRRHGPTLRSRLLYPSTSLWQSTAGLTRARMVFTLNDEDSRYLTATFGVPAARIRRMLPGASEAFAAAARVRRYDAASRLVFSGTWRDNKGTGDLVSAFTELAHRHAELTLTILGAGVDDSVVLSAFPESVRHRVAVIRSTDDAGAVEALGASDIFLLPSLFEGTPLTLIEALMAGLPVVTTDTCGMKDVIEHERTGLLVPIRSPAAIVDAVERLRESAELRERLGRAAHARASRDFTWPRVARQVIAAYDELSSQGASV